MLRADRLIDAVRGHKKSVMYLGSALALAGAGSATAATVGAAPTARPVAPVVTKAAAAASSHPTTHATAAARRQGSTRPDVSSRPVTHTGSGRPSADHQAARTKDAAAHPATHGGTHRPAAHVTHSLTAHATTSPAAHVTHSLTAHATTSPAAHATTRDPASRHPATHRAAHGDTHHPAAHVTHKLTAPASIHPATHVTTRGPAARHVATHPAARIVTWGQVSAKLNQETNPAAASRGETPPADKLLPVATTGQQSWMPITPAQYANATTIVRQALAKRMGVRSAVVAVATAMQESRLLNIDYGTSDSLGLFQQQPDCGWGTAAQVMNPSYASDAFLNALQRYQAGNPTWSARPLYQAAQGVQNSAFPLAYAQWESQAAQLVQSIVMRLA